MRNDGFNLESLIIDELQEPMAWNYFAALPILEINKFGLSLKVKENWL